MSDLFQKYTQTVIPINPTLYAVKITDDNIDEVADSIEGAHVESSDRYTHWLFYPNHKGQLSAAKDGDYLVRNEDGKGHARYEAERFEALYVRNDLAAYSEDTNMSDFLPEAE